MPSSFQRTLAQQLDTTIVNVQSISGGNINLAYRLETTKGLFFVKCNNSTVAYSMLETEAKGLQLLQEQNMLKTPSIIALGQIEDTAFLVLNYIESGVQNEAFWLDFGQRLAQLHALPQAHFGFNESNYIGTLPQSNGIHDTWTDFYREERLQPQFDQALAQGLLTHKDAQSLESLYKRLPNLCPQEAPSLIHGDLWSGNFMVSTQREAILIDPSVGFAHREMDIAMSQLFGGFAPAFYHAYQATYPLTKGFDQRVDIYQLYYLLVHVNLFGSSYVGSVRRILNRYV